MKKSQVDISYEVGWNTLGGIHTVCREQRNRLASLLCWHRRRSSICLIGEQCGTDPAQARQHERAGQANHGRRSPGGDQRTYLSS